MRMFARWMPFSCRFFACVALAFLCSCTRHYSISVDTYADRQFIPNGFRAGSSFAIFPAKDENPMFSKEVSQKISQILQDRGYRVESVKKADYVLIFNSAMTSTTTQINVPRYIPGQTQTTSGSVYGNRGYGGSYSEKTQSSGTTVYVPQDYTFFTRGLAVYVYDAEMYRKHEKEEQVWSGLAISSGENSDLRQVIDYLLISVFSYFGDNTKKSVKIDMAEDNEKVHKLRSELGVILPSGLAPLFSSSGGAVSMEESVIEAEGIHE
jgi:hypothetical protein